MIALVAKQPLAGGFSRRGACPALSAPMHTGDGLLVRLNPVAGGLSPNALIGFCEAAEIHGNGVIEVTARGSVQVRGLTQSSAARFAEAVDRLGISVRTGVPVQTGVLAGLDPDAIADPTALTESIRAGIAKAGLETRLGPKVSVVIDDGGRTALDDVAADVRLTAVGDNGEPKWLVAIAGDARTAKALGLATGDQAACDAAAALLSEIADMGRAAKARDLNDRQMSRVLDSLEARRPTAPPSGAEPVEGPEGGAGGETTESLIGILGLRGDQVALGIALPFGHSTAALLKDFAQAAERDGVTELRPAPKRTLVAVHGTAVAAEALRQQAETLGFITSPDDPRRAISACPGAPDCASGHIPARKMAAEIASEYGGLLDGSMHLHVSGCAKGCAHPAASDLALVGSDTGTGLVANGTARDEAAAFAENDSAGRGFANIAALVSAQRQSGETAAQTIQRIGLSRMAEAFGRRWT